MIDRDAPLAKDLKAGVVGSLKHHRGRAGYAKPAAHGLYISGQPTLHTGYHGSPVHLVNSVRCDVSIIPFVSKLYWY